MWPLVDKRKKKRRHVRYKITKTQNRRRLNRRQNLNWIDLFVHSDDDSEIS